MSFYVLLFIPLLYGGVHMVEISATHTRLAGVSTGNNMLAYSIQQSVFLAARFLLLFLLPCLGFIVDRGVDLQVYQWTIHSALLLASLLSLLVFSQRRWVLGYYVGVIHAYHRTGNMVGALLSRLFHKPDLGENASFMLPQIWSNRHARGILVKSMVVYSIYATGIFISFYFALIFQDYRASISQMSGIVNAAAALILTFYIEPAISKSIDAESDDAKTLIYAMIVGRIIGVSVISHFIVFAAFIYN